MGVTGINTRKTSGSNPQTLEELLQQPKKIQKNVWEEQGIASVENLEKYRKYSGEKSRRNLQGFIWKSVQNSFRNLSEDLSLPISFFFNSVAVLKEFFRNFSRSYSLNLSVDFFPGGLLESHSAFLQEFFLMLYPGFAYRAPSGISEGSSCDVYQNFSQNVCRSF